MSAKCKFCFTPLSPGQQLCPVCKIDSTKDKKQITAHEKKIWHAARNLNIVSFLAILGGALGILGSLLLFISSKSMTLSLFLANVFLAGASFWIGLCLKKYQSWAYIGGIALYSLFLILHFLAERWAGVFFSVVFIYCIANPTAKKILYRKL